MNLPALQTAPPLPADRNPAALYLASLADGPGRVSMRSTLKKIAETLGYGIETCPWHELRYQHVMALRTMVTERYAPKTANKYLCCIRSTLRQAWRLGLMPTEDFQRAIDVPSINGSRLPAGRALDASELRALFEACNDGTPAGARDAAALALMFGCGLRRAEAVAVTLEDFDPSTGALKILGKGNKERTVYASNGGAAAIAAWLEIRGDTPGPILCRINRGGAVTAGEGMGAEALRRRLMHRSAQARIASCSPHDLRRSFVSTALESGADLAMVQALAGHANPSTTARYDRRPEEAKRRAAQLVHVPFAGEAESQ